MDRVYECEFYRLTADERSCFFCDHCTDIFWDTKGPYMFFCEVDADVEVGLRGECAEFSEDDNMVEDIYKTARPDVEKLTMMLEDASSKG